MNRQQLIDAGKIWLIYPDNCSWNVLFEGNKTKCLKYLRDNKLMRQYRTGTMRLAKLIYEPQTTKK